MSIAIRPAVESDVPLILGFVRELADYEKLTHQVTATEALFRDHLFGLRKVAEAMIAELDGAPVGFALYFYNFSTFLGKPGIYLEDLYVRPAARGHGAGKALLTALAQRAVAEGCGRLEWSVLDWNAPSIGFYRKLGAVPMDEWTMMRVTGDALAALAAGKE
jgi:GNAT superfamily N-acetyltransferase